jgi:hypothetical protein
VTIAAQAIADCFRFLRPRLRQVFGSLSGTAILPLWLSIAAGKCNPLARQASRRWVRISACPRFLDELPSSMETRDTCFCKLAMWARTT